MNNNGDQNKAKEKFLEGVAYLERDMLSDAYNSFIKSLYYCPDRPSTLLNLSIVLYKLKKIDDAKKYALLAKKNKPNDLGILNQLGIIHYALKEYDEALYNLKQCIEIDKNFFEAYNNIGSILEEINKFQESLTYYNQAILLRPNDFQIYRNRGNVLKNLNRIDDALRDYNKAITLNPNDYNSKFFKGLLLLLVEKFNPGWELYETRFQSLSYPTDKKFLKPKWKGESLLNKSILVYWEQGLGDTIHFSQFLQLLLKIGAKVIFAPQKPLIRIMSSLKNHAEFKNIEIVEKDSINVSYDYHISLMSIPHLFNISKENYKPPLKYLSADNERIDKWKAFIGTHGYRVGICWRGGSLYKYNSIRSFPLEKFYSISKIQGIRLINLQKSSGESDLDSIPSDMIVESLGGDFDVGDEAFLDTAAIMQNLDLIITCDTSVCHLAGALGLKTWVLLNKVPEWRWFLDHDRSLWYPNLQLYRQNSIGDWDSVFDQIQEKLKNLIG